MHASLIRCAAAALAVAALMIAADQKESPQILLEAAKKKEVVDGDLRAAIRQYGALVAKFERGDRAVAAAALLRMAECHEKLGEAEGRKIFERIVKDFGDQSEAVRVARTRLGGSKSEAPVKGDRAVWTGPLVDLFGRVSPDGRWITFVDWNNGSLMVHDVVSGRDHVLTQPAPNYVENAGYSAFSVDGKQVIYVWAGADGRQSLRIADFRGDQIGSPRQVFLAGENVRFIDSFDWSPDRKWIAAAMRHRDGTGQIALISVDSGRVQTLKSLDWNIPGRIFFSRDSKYIAYDTPGTSPSGQDDINVMAIDGSRDLAAIAHPAKDEVLGWSPDGKLLLFLSDRTGSFGIWAQSVADGRPQGTPEVLRSGIGDPFSLGLTSSGSLYLYRSIGSRDVRMATVNWPAGKLSDPPAGFVRGYLPGAANPAWSHDGKYLAYDACGGRCLAVRSVETGEVRKVPQNLLYVRFPQWSPDGRSVVLTGRDSRGRDGVYQVDVQTGAVSLIHRAGLGSNPRWSADGQKVYYVDRAKNSIIERNISSGSEREIIRDPRMWREANISPDGRYLAVQIAREAAEGASLQLVATDGGEIRELMKLASGESWVPMGNTAWLPDSSAVLKVIQRSGGRYELLQIPVTGGLPRKLEIDPGIWINEGYGVNLGFSLSKDGSKIAFLMGKSASEVWAIENLLPAAAAGR